MAALQAGVHRTTIAIQNLFGVSDKQRGELTASDIVNAGGKSATAPCRNTRTARAATLTSQRVQRHLHRGHANEADVLDGVPRVGLCQFRNVVQSSDLLLINQLVRLVQLQAVKVHLIATLAGNKAAGHQRAFGQVLPYTVARLLQMHQQGLDDQQRGVSDPVTAPEIGHQHSPDGLPSNAIRSVVNEDDVVHITAAKRQILPMAGSIEPFRMAVNAVLNDTMGIDTSDDPFGILPFTCRPDYCLKVGAQVLQQLL
eukprot:CAMPEP_0174290112 /NCGR_PEP_ID=MMETSP0809-20121228/27610_1 /TAXON_ID=73025 ORGANISM="Eutreptiella gymnastica-like, Strain CCMP1594" /NCGR_SAMPLE_ID=MMETSP0809 /ASSEMBLY_ACC=CAM_ASM_000658 /LENGTH=255 /DNA_ID=CAMNT_0015388539 /DNA_START=1736 /DNA_END=2504 /DNA_ORIENTATION=-